MGSSLAMPGSLGPGILTPRVIPTKPRRPELDSEALARRAGESKIDRLARACYPWEGIRESRKRRTPTGGAPNEARGTEGRRDRSLARHRPRHRDRTG